MFTEADYEDLESNEYTDKDGSDEGTKIYSRCSLFGSEPVSAIFQIKTVGRFFAKVTFKCCYF